MRERVLLGLLGLVGRHYWFPSIQLPWSPRLADRMLPDNYRRIVEADTGRIPREGGRAPRYAICYTEREHSWMDEAFGWRARFDAIGVPRLFPSWPRALEELGEPLLAEELKSLDLDPATARFATVILTNPDFVWYDDGKRYFEMLGDAVAELRAAFPGEPILFKAKPNFSKVYGTLEARYGDATPLRLTTMGLAVLARRSSVAVTVNESSGFFDFVVAGVPAIEYADYNSRWRNLIGTTSAWEGVPGLQMVETRAALGHAIQAAKRGEFPVASRAALATHFGHRINLTPFLGAA
jgi:hypothetical protein